MKTLHRSRGAMRPLVPTMPAHGFLSLLCSLACASLAQGATILVPQDHATIQGAIGAATDGDEVVVSPGIYDEDSVDFSGKKIVVRSINPLDPAVVAATVIDAGNRGSVVVFESGEGSLSVLRGFSLRAGLAQRGGGIRCVGSAPMIDHCAIGPNQADDGGGVSAEAPGRPTLAYCNIVDNLAESGGGVYARGEGGGIRIENCAIRRNASTGTSAPGGGALALHLQSYSSILNSYITGNSAVIGGAIDQRYQGKSFLLHTTIAFNEGDGIVVSSSDYATLVNCILWGNEGEQIDGSASFVEVYHCDVEGGFEGGIGNIDSDPAFVDASADNHRLALTSPCIDAGTDVKTTAFDHDGEPRPYGTGIDIGADEASPPLYLELSNLPAEVMTGDSLSYGILAINPSALPQELDSLVVSYSWPQGAEDLVYSGAPISVAPSDTVAWQALTIPAVMGEYEVGARAYRSGDLVGARDRPLVVRPKDRTIRVPADYTTIQSALAFAADGEEVVVAPGTHWEHDIDFLGKGVTVRGESPEDSATVATTVVDANGLGRVFHFSAEGSSPATLAGLTIRGGNVVEDWRGGGGILCQSSLVTIVHCVIEANSSDEFGGGICCRDSSPSIRMCELRSNSAEYGAGLCATESTMEIERTLFTDNSALVSGGAMSVSGGSTLLTNCAMIANDARNGGAIDLDGGSQGSGSNLLACTLIDNQAHYSEGGALDADSRSLVDIRSSIFVGNWPTNIYATYADIVVEYSNIGGGWDGIGNIDEDPLFLAAGDHHISPLSPCVDRGDPIGAPIQDLDGDPRPMGAGVDMGADESPWGIVALLPLGSQAGIVGEAFDHTLRVANLAAEVLPLDSLVVHYAWSGGGPETIHGGSTLWIEAGDTLTWELQAVPSEVGIHRVLAEAFSAPAPTSIAYFDLHTLAEPGTVRVPNDLPSIAGAIALALDGDQVIVEPGTYRESLLSFEGKAIRVSGTEPLDPQVVAATVIDGEGVGPIMSFDRQEGATSVLAGLTLRGGYGTDYGAGIFCENASPTVEYCVIVNNRAGYRGGGASLRNGSPTLRHCRFDGNSVDAFGGGGGLFGDDCNLALIDCEFVSNVGGTGGGGGVRVDGGNLQIMSTVFSSNRADHGGAARLWCESITIESSLFASNRATESAGGGIWLSSSADVVNSILAGNSSALEGGGVSTSYGGDLRLINSTVVGNETDIWQAAGGIHARDGDELVVVNSIVWGNRAWGGGDSQQIQTGHDDPLVAFSDVEGGWPGPGNLDAEPELRGPWHGDFRLSESSPCIDAGTQSLAPTSDYEGDPRPQGNGIDIGADEYARPREIESADRIFSMVSPGCASDRVAAYGTRWAIVVHPCCRRFHCRNRNRADFRVVQPVPTAAVPAKVDPTTGAP